MDPLGPGTIAALAGAAFVAGVIDAVAGGGGLITVPALLAAGLPPAEALATNKGQGVWGSSAALARFARTPLLDRDRAAPGFAAGLAGAVAGTLLVLRVPNRVLEPLVLALLAFAAFAMLAHRPHAAGPPVARPLAHALLVAAAVGAYDGFFGPGTGTFLIIACAWWWRDPLDAASANAKPVNCGSNWGALLVFAALGRVHWIPALAMGAGQLVGGWIGAHLVLRRGRGLVRALAIVVSLALAARVAWQMAQR